MPALEPDADVDAAMEQQEESSADVPLDVAEREQMEKLLSNGKTDLLNRFVSSRTKRAFKAYLVKKDDNTIGFEFEPRPKKKATNKKTTTKKAPAKPSKTFEKEA